MKDGELVQIYERIKYLRKKYDLSAETIAESIGVSRATVYRYETKEVENMPITILEPLSKVLHCSPAYLMGWEDESSDLPKHTYNLNSKEELLLTDFRTLNEQGQDYILQTMDMVKDKYKKSNMLSDMEEII